MTFDIWQLKLIFHDIDKPWHFTLIYHDIWHLMFDIWDDMTWLDIWHRYTMKFDIWHLTLDTDTYDIDTILSRFDWWILWLSWQSENDSQSVRDTGLRDASASKNAPHDNLTMYSVLLQFTLFWRNIHFVAFYPRLCGAKIYPKILSVEQKLQISCMTHFKIEVRSLCKGVSKILPAYRIDKIFFSFYDQKEEISSFPAMYNTWGGSFGRNGSKQ